MYQSVTIAGYLGQDPELRYTPNGTAVCSFSVATKNTYKNQQKVTVEETTWWRITCWSGLAENCNQYLSKGRLVLIEGRMITDPENGSPKVWFNKDGQAKASFELRANMVKFLGGGDSQQGNGQNVTPQVQKVSTQSNKDDTIPW